MQELLKLVVRRVFVLIAIIVVLALVAVGLGREILLNPSASPIHEIALGAVSVLALLLVANLARAFSTK